LAFLDTALGRRLAGREEGDAESSWKVDAVVVLEGVERDIVSMTKRMLRYPLWTQARVGWRVSMSVIGVAALMGAASLYCLLSHYPRVHREQRSNCPG